MSFQLENVSYINIIKKICKEVITGVHLVTIGLDQGSILNSYIFMLVMDDITRELKDEVPCNILFVDDILLIEETRESLSRNLDSWRKTLVARKQCI